MQEKIIGIIGGTGLGDALTKQIKDAKRRKVTTPFGEPSSDIIVGRFGHRTVAFINRHGAGHRLSPSQIPFAANIFALKKLGVHTMISSGAVGSLRARIKPGELVVVDQFIDKTYRKQRSFFDGFGAVHCEMTKPVCDRLHGKIIEEAKKIRIKVHSKGVYICMEGPQFSTRAESQMHRLWGGDCIGMTAMPEAKLAREAQICYAMIALVSDYDCWRPHSNKNKQTLLQEIVANLQKATENCLRLIEAVLHSKSELADEDCSCRKSLQLAVWTAKKQISRGRKKVLSPLFE